MAATQQFPGRARQASYLLQARQTIAQLFNDVLDEAITPRQAINRWPLPKGRDLSVDVAYQMLLHFEADEERQKTELYYADMQLTLLAQVADCFAKGESLPAQLLAMYPQQHRTGYYADEQVFWAPVMLWGRWLGEAIRLAKDILGGGEYRLPRPLPAPAVGPLSPSATVIPVQQFALQQPLTGAFYPNSQPVQRPSLAVLQQALASKKNVWGKAPQGQPVATAFSQRLGTAAGQPLIHRTLR